MASSGFFQARTGKQIPREGNNSQRLRDSVSRLVTLMKQPLQEIEANLASNLDSSKTIDIGNH